MPKLTYDRTVRIHRRLRDQFGVLTTRIPGATPSDVLRYLIRRGRISSPAYRYELDHPRIWLRDYKVRVRLTGAEAMALANLTCEGDRPTATEAHALRMLMYTALLEQGFELPPQV